MEKAVVYRRRLGLSQSEMAAIFGVHRATYGYFERGEKELSFPELAIEPLEPHEICFLMRRRSGASQRDCADEMGITRYWYNLMEQGKAPSERLVKYWGQE